MDKETKNMTRVVEALKPKEIIYVVPEFSGYHTSYSSAHGDEKGYIYVPNNGFVPGDGGSEIMKIVSEGEIPPMETNSYHSICLLTEDDIRIEVKRDFVMIQTSENSVENERIQEIKDAVEKYGFGLRFPYDKGDSL